MFIDECILSGAHCMQFYMIDNPLILVVFAAFLGVIFFKLIGYVLQSIPLV